MKLKKIFYFFLFASLASLPIIGITFKDVNNQKIILFNNNVDDNLSYKREPKLTFLEIDPKFANALVDVDGDKNHGNITEILSKTFTDNIDLAYGNLNYLPDAPLDGVFSYENRRIDYDNNINKVIITCDIIPRDKSIFNLPTQNSEQYINDNLKFMNFKFIGFNPPQETKLLSATLKDSSKNLFPFEVTNFNFKQHIDFNFQHAPKNLEFIPNFQYNNFNGNILINNILYKKYYPNNEYKVVNGDKTIDCNIVINGFKVANITNIDNVTFNGTDVLSLKNQILNYLISNNMVPESYTINNIIITISDNYLNADVTLNGYFDANGVWRNEQLKQKINLNTNSTHINETINSNSLLSSYYSPHQIKYLIDDNNHDVISIVKRIIIDNLKNTSTPPTPNDIVINNVVDKNISGDASISIDFNLNRVGIENGNEIQTINRNTTIVGLRYEPTTLSVIKQKDLTNKAADYITPTNWTEYIKINNMILGSTYSLVENDIGVDFNNGYATFIINSSKMVDPNSGRVVDTKSSLPQLKIDNFAKVPDTIFGWKNAGVIPFAIAADEQYIKNNYVITNASSYQNITFKGDKELNPSIDNIKLIRNNNDGKIDVEIQCSNIIKQTKIVSGTERTSINALATIEGIFLKPNTPENITNDNIYQYLEIKPGLWNFFGLSDSWKPEELKEKLNAKGFRVIVENNIAKLYFQNEPNPLGIIKILFSDGNNSNSDTLNILYIVLIVVGVVGAILLIIFFVIYNMLNKKEKALKQKKNSEQNSDEQSN